MHATYTSNAAQTPFRLVPCMKGAFVAQGIVIVVKGIAEPIYSSQLL